VGGALSLAGFSLSLSTVCWYFHFCLKCWVKLGNYIGFAKIGSELFLIFVVMKSRSRDSSGSRAKWHWLLSRLAEAAEESPRTSVAKHHWHEHAIADSPGAAIKIVGSPQSSVIQHLSTPDFISPQSSVFKQ